MVVPIRKSDDKAFTHFLEWALEKLGMYTPPKPTYITLVDPSNITTGLSSYLKDASGNDYASVMAGRLCDNELALVRKDGAVDVLSIEGDSFRLCSRTDEAAVGDEISAAVSCRYFTLPTAYLAELLMADATPVPPEKIQVAGRKNLDPASNDKVARLYFSLAPTMRGSLTGIAAGAAAPVDAWQLSSMGIVNTCDVPNSAEFYESAARVLTVKIFSEGMPVMKQWDAMREGTPSSSDLLSADDIAKTVGMIYARPDEAKAAAKSDSTLERRIQYLADLGYLREDQKKFLFGLSGGSTPYVVNGEELLCSASPAL
ncbi:MAG: hypothetical protein WC956_05750 [bacterium]